MKRSGFETIGTYTVVWHLGIPQCGGNRCEHFDGPSGWGFCKLRDKNDVMNREICAVYLRETLGEVGKKEEQG